MVNMAKKCNAKYMKTDYNWTPNDYDISFDVDMIPSNIDIDNVINLTNTLQRNMPLSKKIHLQLNDYSPERHKKNLIGIHTGIKFDNGAGEREVDII